MSHPLSRLQHALPACGSHWQANFTLLRICQHYTGLQEPMLAGHSHSTNAVTLQPAAV